MPVDTSSVLDRNVFLVKEHVGLFKAANNFDIFDPETGGEILQCREDALGAFTKALRFTKYKRMTPFEVEVRLPSGERVLSIHRGVSVFLSTVEVRDASGATIGGFKQKFFSVGGKFDVLDAAGDPVCSLKGKWTGWNFKFAMGDTVFATVSKKWSGLGKEFFTSADNYALEIADNVPAGAPLRTLIMAAVLCIDMVLKE